MEWRWVLQVSISDPFDSIFDGFEDTRILERYARSVTIGMGGSAGYAFPVMSGRDLKRCVISGG